MLVWIQSNIIQPIQGGKDMLQKSLLLLFTAQSCLTLCDSMDRSTPGFSVLHYLPEFAQTHVHWVKDAIQPSHPLLLPFPPAFNLTQHQGIFQWIDSSNQVAKVLAHQLQYQSFQWTLSGFISLKIDWFDLLAAQGTFKGLWVHPHTSHRAGPSGEVATIM